MSLDWFLAARPNFTRSPADTHWLCACFSGWRTSKVDLVELPRSSSQEMLNSIN